MDQHTVEEEAMHQHTIEEEAMDTHTVDKTMDQDTVDKASDDSKHTVDKASDSSEHTDKASDSSEHTDDKSMDQVLVTFGGMTPSSHAARRQAWMEDIDLEITPRTVARTYLQLNFCKDLLPKEPIGSNSPAERLYERLRISLPNHSLTNCADFPGRLLTQLLLTHSITHCRQHHLEIHSIKRCKITRSISLKLQVILTTSWMIALQRARRRRLMS